MVKLNKILILFLLFGFAAFGKQAIAAMSSNNYKVWLDNLSSGGGALSSENYAIDSNFTDQAGANSQSMNFKEKPSFSGIGAEPTIGFSVQLVSLNFGELSPSSTAYSSHTFSAYTNSKAGYTIKIIGESLHSSEHAVTPIGSVAADSEPGTEQFGINLVSNSVPLIGSDPLGGIGWATPNYNTTNKFAYNDGDIIAQSLSFSYQTDFTVSVIVNIAPETNAGNYGATLTYEFIPVF
ncbi:MAG: hypothetical protein WC460_05710 [Patescibacteria group bacterium]